MHQFQILLVIVITIFKTSHGRQQESSTLNDIQYGKYLNKGTSMDCFDAFENCRKIPECRAALRGLNKKCKVVSGRCSAEMVDLPRCGQIMDHLFLYGFPETRCKCEHNLGRCFTMLNKIYANPCFARAKELKSATITPSFETSHSGESSSASPTSGLDSEMDGVSIRHLRKNDLFPQEITAYDEVSGVESTTALTDTTKPEMPKTQEVIIEDEFDPIKDYTAISFYEEVFGDEGFAEPPPRRETVAPTALNKYEFADVKTLEPESSQSGTIKQYNEIAEEGIVLMNAPIRNYDNKVYDLSSANADNKNIDQTIKEDNTNYKLIAIILGILLTIFVLAVIIFVACTRLRGKALYSPGKIVKDNREEEGTHHSRSNNNEKLSNSYIDSNA